jgi:Holliday junction resolvase RusA-like endonuclease
MFVVFGQPATKGSSVSFMGEDGRIVTKADCKNLAAWSQAVGWAARAARIKMAPAGTPVRVTAVFQFVRPKSARGRLHPTVKPDSDKLGRALLDALKGVGFFDDAQVVWLELRKRYGPDARTTVTITGV